MALNFDAPHPKKRLSQSFSSFIHRACFLRMIGLSPLEIEHPVKIESAWTVAKSFPLRKRGVDFRPLCTDQERMRILF